MMATKCLSTVAFGESTSAIHMPFTASCIFGFGSCIMRYNFGTNFSRCGFTASPARFAMDAKPNAAPREELSARWWFAKSINL